MKSALVMPRVGQTDSREQMELISYPLSGHLCKNIQQTTVLFLWSVYKDAASSGLFSLYLLFILLFAKYQLLDKIWMGMQLVSTHKKVHSMAWKQEKYLHTVAERAYMWNQVCWEQKTLACTNNNIPTLNWSRNCNLSSSNVVIFLLWRTRFCGGSSVEINTHICKSKHCLFCHISNRTITRIYTRESWVS